MIVLGVVGSPSGGKSTVAACLEELGAAWINADLIARQVLETPEIQRQLLGHFGQRIADKEGRIDRAKLAGEVFGADASKRAQLTYLEGLIHPRTRQRILAELQRVDRQWQLAGSPWVVVLDVPLLFEVGWDRCCDQVWCVDADRARRLQWARPRGWDDAEMRRRESSQWAIAEKKRLSTRVISNLGGREQLRETILRLWSSLEEKRNQLATDQHCSAHV